MKQQKHEEVTNTAPKVRQALDDMKTSSVKRNAVATHDIVNRVTPNLHHSQPPTTTS